MNKALQEKNVDISALVADPAQTPIPPTNVSTPSDSTQSVGDGDLNIGAKDGAMDILRKQAKSGDVNAQTILQSLEK